LLLLSQLALITGVWNLLGVTGLPQTSVPLLSFGHLSDTSARQESYTSGKGTRHETMCGPYKAVAVAFPPHAPTVLTRCSPAFPEHRFAELVCVFLPST